MLTYRPPFDWAGVIAFLRARAIDGVEHVDADVYRRMIRCGDAAGTIEVAHDEAAGALLVTVKGFQDDDADAAVERVRWMFDLDADLTAITRHLSRDPAMASLLSAHSAVRVFRGSDPFEVAARSVIGQQVSVARARQLNGILIERCSADAGMDRNQHLRRLFPTSRQVLDADLITMGMPSSRVSTLKHLAEAAVANPRLFEPASSIEETVARLRAIHGIGDWTAHYIAMRACGDPDAFPASDIGLLRGAADSNGRRPTPAELLARAEAWRPFRAYAAHCLWAADASFRRPPAPAKAATCPPEALARRRKTDATSYD